MSSRSPRQHLRDILQAIDQVESFIAKMDFDEYQAGLLTKRAVERGMGILSEAATRLGPDAESFCPGPDWRNIRGLGNVLRHEYDTLIDRVLWDAMQKKLPSLREDVTRSLATLEDRPPSFLP